MSPARSGLVGQKLRLQRLSIGEIVCLQQQSVTPPAHTACLDDCNSLVRSFGNVLLSHHGNIMG
jgi:hypothetical protein